MNLRQRAWEIVEVAKPGDRVSLAFDVSILTLIFCNVVAVILGTVQAIAQRFGGLLEAFEVFSVAVFTLEYVVRLWACTADPRFAGAVRGRVRLAVRPLVIIDLLAIAPFYLPLFGLDLRFVRLLRLMRVLRVAKVARYYDSLSLIKSVIISRKEELTLTTVLLIFLLVFSSGLLYYCENAAQPEVFSSIPAAMWWAVATLTTVGYGDIYPVTVQGKLFASLIAVVGIGMFALPVGIIGAGFVEAVQKSHRPKQTCPHCGKLLDAAAGPAAPSDPVAPHGPHSR